MRVTLSGRKYTLSEFERPEFLAERWRYESGQHATFLAPTQQGKTTFAYQLIEASASPKLPALSLIMKPRDKVPAEWLRRLGHPRLQAWPPSPWHRLRGERPSGWALWPKRTGRGVRADNVMLADRFGRALDDTYEKGNRILFADEAVGLSRILKLDPELVALWTQGAGMGAGMWAASQKPSHIPTWAYNSAEHIFLSNEPDARNRKRFGEIGGVDPRLVEAVVLELEQYQWLYLRRTGRVMCVVGA